jgi:hypothetical protein
MARQLGLIFPNITFDAITTKLLPWNCTDPPEISSCTTTVTKVSIEPRGVESVSAVPAGRAKPLSAWRGGAPCPTLSALREGSTWPCPAPASSPWTR